MKVQVLFYAQLRDLAGVSELRFDLESNSTVADLLDELYRLKPALRSQDKNILIGAGLEFVERDYKIKPGQEVSIMPPVQGG